MYQKDLPLQHLFKSSFQQLQFRCGCAHLEEAIIDKCHPLQDHQEIKYYPFIKQAQESPSSQVSGTQFQFIPRGKNPESAEERIVYTPPPPQRIQAQEVHIIYPEQIYFASVIPTCSSAELREFKHNCITQLTNQTQPSILFNHNLRDIRHITTSALHFQNLLWRKSVNITNDNITESYSWIRRCTLQGRPDQAYLEPADQVTYQYRCNKWMVYQVRNLWMTRRDLMEEETNSIPVYLEAPFFSIEDSCILTWWDTKLVYSTLGENLWKFDTNNKYILDEDFEEWFPGYSQLTNILVDNKTFTAQYKGSDVHWSFKHRQWRYNNHKPVKFEEPENPPESEDEQAEVSQLLESTVQTVSALQLPKNFGDLSG